MNKIIKYKLKPFQSVNIDEYKSIKDLFVTGKLSGFLAGNNKEFYGGKNVLNFEKKINNYFNVKYSITVNSWTSGLIIALKAMDLKKNDEVILPAWTMSACLAAILINGLKPIFCDINEDNFTLCVNDLKKKITNKTKAIIAVDLFGACCEYDKIFEITKKRNIKILSDSAQAIGAKYKKRYTSTFTDIGGFSLNRHKHINTGEGGIIVTNNKKYAYRCALLRNHGENTVIDKDPKLRKMMGYNLRLGEIEAKIGIQQLKKLKKIIIKRKQDCKKIYSSLANLDGLIIPNKNYIKQSIFYYLPFKIDNTKIANNKEYIINQLKKTGLQGLEVYYPQLNRLPYFKKKEIQKCPVSERINKNSFFALKVCSYEYDSRDLELIIKCFEKVWKKLKYKNVTKKKI